MRSDPARLAELRRLLILDSPPDPAYDDITRMLAAHLDVPIAIVNLLDADRDWFKSCIGLDARESSTALSFCEAFFHSPDDVIVVEDTLTDPRFYTNPFVVKPPFIRFYAAAKLVVRGQTVGTLCAYDIKTKRITTDQLADMRLLAGAAVELMSRRGASGG
jgi:GAF domain-containing protein